ncbi:MAG: hypothetical protein K6E63_09720 [Lachnospiraceae bacterium]|nr:hypothetical protein [Lachnospiraceae bacterium]
MHIVIQVYNSHSLEEFVFKAYPLPDERATALFKLRSDMFRLKADRVISLIISNNGVALNGTDTEVYHQYQDKKIKCENIISDDAGLVLVTGDREVLKMAVYFASDEGMRFYKVGDKDLITVGNSPKRTVSLLGNQYISDLQLMFRKADAGGIMNVRSETGCYLNGRYIGPMNTAELKYGDVITTGGVRLLWLDECIGFEALYIGPPCVVRLKECTRLRKVDRSRGDDGFTPGVRNLIRTDNPVIELDAPPPAPNIRRQPAYLAVGPSLTMAVPMCLGCGMYIYAASRAGTGGSAIYMYTGLVTAIASAILGTVWAVANLRQSRRQEKEDERQRIRTYKEYINSCTRRIEDKYRYNRNALKRNSPGLDEILKGNLNSFVLNRRLDDEDLYRYRLGTGKCRFEVDIRVPKEKYMPVPDELASLPLKLKQKYLKISDVPICTDIKADRIQGFIGRNGQGLEQLFLNIALQIAATTGPELIRMVFLFGDNVIPEGAVRIMRWLPQAQGDDGHYVCTDRDRNDELLCFLEGIIKNHENIVHRWIVFTDDHKRLPPSLLSREDLSLLVFAKEYRSLPGECRCIIQNDASYRGMLMPGREELRRDICFDHISLKEAEGYIRRIAGVCRYVKSAVKPIPALVTLPMLYDTDNIRHNDIAAFWRDNNTINSIRAPIGMAGDQRVISLDLHEKAHGPHGLVAGMTGSGKSELLQTLILSLALRYPPWEVGFFLIDYKGGGMASMFEGLPHLIGSISNLSGNITDRALLSIRSENERRQRLFLDAGVNSIRDYGRKFLDGTVAMPLPHILIIIDEFAELKREQPEFMKELISVAQVGRSLGVHLILATQKPAGTVDDNIFSNSRFRICLRVQDKQDSNDMLHRPDAAYIKNPGRAYFQVGNDELFEEFQSGYTMEPCMVESDTGTLCLLDRNGRRIKVSENHIENEEADTHFSMSMKVIRRCYEESDHATIQKLWLPELDTRLVLNETAIRISDDEPGVIIGRYDDPENREQGDYRIDLLRTGHMAVCGSAQSGKSTLLQTLIMSLLSHTVKIDPAIYIVDYSNGILSCFRDSVLVGAYINEDTQDRLGNLFCLIREIIDRRRTQWDGISFSNRRDQYAISDKAIILVIDNYGAFREKTDCIYDDAMQEFIKYGETYGVFVILTGSAIGSSDIPVRLFENIRTGICLRLNDRYQYSECLRQIHLPVMPAEAGGRGLAYISGRILEFQTYLILAENDRQRNELIKKEVGYINVNDRTVPAKRVPFIPKEPSVEDLDGAIKDIILNNGQLPIGYDAVSARPFIIDLSDTPCLMFAGACKSGKSNALRVIRHYAERAGIKVKDTGSIRSIYEAFREEPDVLVICDGIESVIDDFYKNDRDEAIEKEMTELIGKKGHCMVFTVSSSGHAGVAGRRIYEQIRAVCMGIYLGGSIDKQNVFDFSYLPYSLQCRAGEAGMGTVLRRGRAASCNDVVIPYAEEVK